MKSFVYFVQAESTGKIKIGQSDDVPKRMYALQCASPGKLTLLGKLSTKVVREEELHRRFHVHRAFGEWFDPAEEIMCYIRENAVLDAGDIVPTYKRDPKHRIARKLEAEAAKVAKAADEAAAKAAKEAEIEEQKRINREEFTKRYPGTDRVQAFVGQVLAGISVAMASKNPTVLDPTDERKATLQRIASLALAGLGRPRSISDLGKASK